MTDQQRTRRQQASRMRNALLGLAAALVALFFSDSGAFCQSADSTAALIGQVKSSNISDRTAASKALIGDWAKSLNPLVKELAKLEPTAQGANPPPADLSAMIGVTDTLRSILANNQTAIAKFRDLDNDPSVIQSLAWMARSENRDLRINSTYILANVVDNTNVCIVLDHLRDPNISANGRVNLLQTVAPVAGYAYKDNVETIQKSLPVVKSNAMTSTTKANIDQTNALIDQLQSRLAKSTNADQSLSSAHITASCPAHELAPLH